MTFKTHFKFLIVALAAAAFTTNSFSQEETEDQPEGTNLTPWVKYLNDELIDVPLHDSTSLFPEGMSIIYLEEGWGLLYSFNASRPSAEERGDFRKMKVLQNFSFSFITCGPEEEEETVEMWKKTIAQTTLHSEMSDTAELSESIRELVLFTNSLTNTKGTVDTWWDEETGSKGTGIKWADTISKREYSLSAWEAGDSDENWVTFHIIREPMCP